MMVDPHIEFYNELIQDAKNDPKLVKRLKEKIRVVGEKQKEIDNHPLKRAEKKIKWLKEETKRLFPDANLNKLEVLWDINSASLAGQHKKLPGTQNHQIRFNKIFLMSDPDDFIEETIPHEWAHFIISATIGRKYGVSHGHEWKCICMVLGMKKIEKIHNYHVLADAQVRKHKKYKYLCNCDTPHDLSTIRHNKHQRTGQTLYYCKYCKGYLRLAE